MASAGVQEPPQTIPASSAVPSTSTSTSGDATTTATATATSTAQGDVDNITNTTNATIATGATQDDNNSTSASASASATASPFPIAPASDLPPRIVSDIEPVVGPPPAPPATALPISAAGSAPSASPSVYGLGARPGRTSTSSNTPTLQHHHRHSPALPSPPIPLRGSPAATQPPLVTAATRAPIYQNNPVLRAQPTPHAQQKPPISSAPATGSPAPLPKEGFPSPGRERIHADQKFLDDKTRITYGIQQAIPEAVRRSVRDNWEKCLLGSDFHQAFILNASIHHATHAAVQRGIRDFGRAMISSARAEIVDNLTTADIDAVAVRLLSKASDSFLDAALELRLKSIDAKRLINALARAERLGYEPSDVVDEDDDPAASQPPVFHELAMPSPAPQPAPRQPALQPQPCQPGAIDASVMYCKLCFRKFVHKSAHDHHIKNKICTRSPAAPGGYKFSCQHCGQGFTTIMGVQYHNANNICGEFKEPFRLSHASAASTPATPRPTPTPRATEPAPTAPASNPMPTPALMSTPMSTPASAQAVAPPSSSSGGLPRKGTPGLHTPDGAVSDPYAHLSPEQLAAMQEELRLAELSYGERFRQANEIEDAGERKSRIDGLSNSFGTKQSLIRKKYGVRLRMRRTKAEIQAERDRMQYRTAAELAAAIGIPSTNLGRPGRPIASTPSRPPAVIARSSNGGTGAMWSSVNRPGAPNGAPAPQATMSAGGPGITDVSMHAGSKRRLSGSSPYSESKRVAYSEMGGLSGGAAAHAETMDPTLPADAGARSASTFSTKGRGTAEEPMALDDSESESDDSGEDDGDIPAELPPSVRQSLQQASRSVTPRSQATPRPSSGPRSGDIK